MSAPSTRVDFGWLTTKAREEGTDIVMKSSRLLPQNPGRPTVDLELRALCKTRVGYFRVEALEFSRAEQRESHVSWDCASATKPSTSRSPITSFFVNMRT